MLKKIFLSAAICLSVVNLTACDDQHTKSSVSSNKNDITFQNLIAKTHSFSTGPETKNFSDRLYVFFDPQCPHCTQLWLNAQDNLNKDIPIVWIPVAFLNENSLPQSAAILSSSDSVNAMNQHEALRKQGKPGIEAKMINPKFYEEVKDNNIQFDATKAQGVPLILKQDKDGSLKGASGELTPQLLNDFYHEKIKN